MEKREAGDSFGYAFSESELCYRLVALPILLNGDTDGAAVVLLIAKGCCDRIGPFARYLKVAVAETEVYLADSDLIGEHAVDQL